MTSPPFDSTHGRTTSGMTCHHRLWKAHTFTQRRAWIEITTLRLHARLEDVGHGMTSPPLGSTHVERRRAWHSIIAFGQHTRSNDVGRGTTSPPLNSTHGRTMSGVTCHHRLYTAHSVERRQVWHDIIAIGQHTRSNDIEHGMTSPPSDCTHGRTTSGVV
uniref:Uncharacterized protein n=1 Tax=Solanum lycopersicum TaxID=4081 RepID=A0A3Q7II67_SOLLC